jgi:hypothetical protein
MVKLNSSFTLQIFKQLNIIISFQKLKQLYILIIFQIAQRKSYKRFRECKQFRQLSVT